MNKPANDSTIANLEHALKDIGADKRNMLKQYVAFCDVILNGMRLIERETAGVPRLPGEHAINTLFQDTAVKAQETVEIWRLQRALAEGLLLQAEREATAQGN